jgi:murein peptide amidase A
VPAALAAGAVAFALAQRERPPDEPSAEAGGRAAAIATEAAPTSGRERPPRSGLGRLVEMIRGGRPRPRTFTVGRSVEGRPIRAQAVGGFGPTRVLAIGCIHGDECAGAVLGDALRRRRPAPSDTVFVPNLNPDGRVAGTRVNARGVDLNRNLPAGWRPAGRPGDPEHSGPRRLSEPESRLTARIVRRLRPDVTIWFHQQAEPLVRAWGPSVEAARRYADAVGLPFQRLQWLPGSAPNWQNRRFPGTSSFVVELAPGALSTRSVWEHATAVLNMGSG